MSKQKKKSKKNKKKNWLTKKKWLLILFSIPFLLILLNLLANIYFLNKSLPNVYVNSVNVGNWESEQIQKKVEEIINKPITIKIKIKDKDFEISSKSIDLTYDANKTTNNAFLAGKANFAKNLYLIPKNIFYTKKVPLFYTFNEEKLNEFVDILVNENTPPPANYKVELTKNGVEVDPGKIGKVIDRNSLKQEILDSFSSHLTETLEPEITEIDETLTPKEADDLLLRAKNLVGKKITLSYGYESVPVVDSDLVGFLAKDGSYNKVAVKNFVDQEVVSQVERPAQNAFFVYKDERVEEFKPAQDGVVVDRDSLTEKIIASITNIEENDLKTVDIEIPVSTQKPDTELDDVNNLGINQLIGRGVSTFRGSISSRIFNIEHASKKFNNILVAPGETFSFVKILGDVTALTGYKQAYIIKDGRTVLGDGGGVCQVSTTLFRAVLNAGLPVIERRAHSYRVGYYEQNYQPGVDATVYYPTTDFKFKNDTPAYILIQTIFDPKNYTLVFEIYGTSDGRVSTISKSTISSVIAPPDDLYVDDPTLPAAEIKQIDHKAWGAKVSFNYNVERNGETLINKTFVSNYQPWQSVFLRGIGP